MLSITEVILELAGLADHDIALACNSASAYAGELSADICGEVNACGVEYLCDHRCCGGLAVSTRNADSVAVPARYDTEEVCTFQHGDSACSCGNKLGVVSHDSGSVYDKVCALDVLGSLTDEYGDTHFSYCVESFCLVVVRACKVVAL